MTHRCPTETHCNGCGIPLSDGYVVGCQSCNNRRFCRVKRGELFSPTGYAGEAIDNRTGRIVASGGVAACVCLEYGHGMNLTRVISRSCPAHGGGDRA